MSTSGGSTSPVATGPVGTTTIAAPGAGYAVNDTGTIDGGGTLAHYTVATIGPLGAVTAVTIGNSGAGYDTTSNPHNTTNAAPQPGIGVGLQLNVTTLEATASVMRMGIQIPSVPNH